MSTRREDLGSWLEGTPGGSSADGASALALPDAGPGSLAPVVRRLAALAVDWALCLGISATFWPVEPVVLTRLLSGDPTATLLVFLVSTSVLVGLLGHTVGHRLLGLRVVPVELSGRGSGPASSGGTAALPVRPPGLLRGLVRTVLLCLVVPAVVWNAEGRGMHDVAARTVVVRR